MKRCPPLHAFLSHVALENSDNQADPFEDSVQLMTLHSAKGLEFELVIMAGVEEGLFPHHMSKDEPGRMEEERRLCYVGMTRAKEKLFITFAECRRLYGRENYHQASRFIKEIPAKYLDEIRTTTRISRPVSFTPKPISKQFANHSISDTGYKIGQNVHHKKFGEGTIINFEGSGDATQIQVQFKKAGTKWLVASFAKLEAV